MAIKKRYNTSSLGSSPLGRGLDALISTEEPQTQGTSTINEIDISQISANPNQPRRDFDETALDELAASIREIGIIQPITLRETENGHYEIIAGERRWRASQRAGLKSIPAYVKTVSDKTMMEMALVENIQREDLNSIEIALAYQHLVSATGMTQEKVAERVGKSRAQVANFIRLLRLPAEVQMALQSKEIEMGQARALLGLDSPSQQVKVFREIKKNNYSTRQVEQMVNALKNGASLNSEKKNAEAKRLLTAYEKQLQKQITSALGTKVKVSCTQEDKGKISIDFSNKEELDLILNKLNI